MPNKVKSTLAILLLSLLGLTAFFFYTQEKSNSNPWIIENLKPFKWWYQINWQNQSVGWASLELKESDNFYILVEEDFITGRVQTERMEFKFKRTLQFTKHKPYRLDSLIIESNEPSLAVKKLVINREQLSVTETRNGKEETYHFKNVDYSLKDYLAKFQWVTSDRLDKTLIAKEFNNDDFGLHYSRYQALNIEGDIIIKHQLQNTAMLDDNYQSQASRLTFNDKGELIREVKANGMEYLWSDGKVTINPEMQRDLYFTSGIKVSQPLGLVSDIVRLSLTLPEEAINDFSNHPAIQIKGNQILLNSAYKYKPNRAPKAQVGHPRAKDLAEVLITGIDSRETQIKTLLNYVNKELHYQTLPASFEIDDILDNKIGDCTEHALLLSEMLNGVGIPARQVSGLIYLGDDKLQFGGHVWVEVYVNGYWQAVDPTWNLFAVTATHIPLVIGAHKTPKLLQNTSNLRFLVDNIVRR